MARSSYVPERGDFVWIDLSPRLGHEQAGRRPALVLSPSAYNRKTGLCILCPATRQVKGYPFEVRLPDPAGSPAAILADHVRCVDWRVRDARLIRRVPPEVLEEAAAKLEALIVNP
ncbi:MAG: endoribonuclease MazF [Planctomycetes bacterium]|nr:endoribonuclease MazF [Planctomycetota bacterium]